MAEPRLVKKVPRTPRKLALGLGGRPVQVIVREQLRHASVEEQARRPRRRVELGPAHPSQEQPRQPDAKMRESRQ